MNNDLISRKALKKKIEEVQYSQDFCVEHHIDYSVSMQMLGMVIDNAPTVDTTFNEVVAYECGKKSFERPQGEWLWLGFDDGDSRRWSCSLCGRGVKNQENFCPNCGADMRGDKE